MYPRRGGGPRAAPNLPGLEHGSDPARRRPSRDHPIAPTEFFKDRSAPETRSAGREAHLPRDCSMRSSKGGCHEARHVDQLVDGYGPRLTPGNLARILANGQSSTDLIHTESAQVSRGFGHLSAHPRAGGRRSSARPPPRPERTAARSTRGKRPVKYETVRATTRVAGWRGWPGPPT